MSELILIPHLFFADDLKIHVEIKSTEDCILLQSTIHNWCFDNYLLLNLSKRKVVSCHRKQNPINFKKVCFNYYHQFFKNLKCE